MLDLKKILDENKFVLSILVISTVIFLCMHHVRVSWDFMVYTLNAKYLVGLADYYELSRPPLIPITILSFSIFGWVAAEYLFIIAVSVLFFFSSIKLAKSLGVNKELFYFFSFSPYLFFYGLFTGAELLGLALLGLFLASLIEKKSYAGLFLVLGLLTRYNYFIFAPLLLTFGKDIKKIIKNGIFFALPLIPWFAFNFFFSGNMFTSIVDGYAVNMKYRYYVNQPANYLIVMAEIVLFLAPFFLIGLFHTISKIRVSKLKFLKENKISLLILIFLLLALYQYGKIPFKFARYAFPAVIPVVYFSVIGATVLHRKSRTAFKIIIIAILLASIIFALTFESYYIFRGHEKTYKTPMEKMEELGIGDCRTLSNAWPILNYYDKNTEKYPRKYLMQKNVDEGNFILFIYSEREPEWIFNKTFLYEFPVIYDDDDFILIGDVNKCNPTRKVDQTYLSELHDYILIVYNYSINTNPCFVMFGDISILERSCNFVNLKGFSLDENRILE